MQIRRKNFIVEEIDRMLHNSYGQQQQQQQQQPRMPFGIQELLGLSVASPTNANNGHNLFYTTLKNVDLQQEKSSYCSAGTGFGAGAASGFSPATAGFGAGAAASFISDLGPVSPVSVNGSNNGAGVANGHY
uniref:Uncharacterized protein n=1 Tax=Romanomermis culicivorax TaxID=13658 RepID=A0A915K9D4_ROMCU